jgi:glycosyltransferase involved in cell wall biosynthesis
MHFSIIVPFYNNISHIDNLFITLRDYVNSLNCEIIIIDDFSNYDIFCCLNEYIEKLHADNIFLFRNKENGGAAFSRQKGVELARGEYIFFLDADDGWVKNRAFILYDYAKLNSVNIMGGFTVAINKDVFLDKRNSNFNVMNLRPLCFNNFLFKNFFSTPSVVVKKDIFLKHGFDTEMRYSEDFECWRRVVIDGKAFFLKESGTYSFKHAFISQKHGSLSSNSLKMSKGELKGLAKLLSSSQISLSNKSLILVALIYSAFKAVIREIRIQIKL